MDDLALEPRATDLDAYLAATSSAVEALQGIDRMVAELSAIRLHLLDTLRVGTRDAPVGQREMALRSMRAELACALRVPERTIDRQWGDAATLIRDLPDTFTALSEGRISVRHAQILATETTGLDEEERADVERVALAGAHRGTGEFARYVRRLRNRRAPERMVERHRAAAEGRDVTLTAEHDGMAWLAAYLPAPEAVAIHSRIDDAARAWKRDGDDRPIGQLRAEAFCDILLNRDRDSHSDGDGDGGRFGGFTPTVVVTIPALTLLDRSDEPAILDGYGPIDIDTAAHLAAEAPVLRRMLTDPHTGIPLSLDRTRYRPTEDLKLWLRLRDRTCRFTDCPIRTAVAEIDHRLDWAHGGVTADHNLEHLCTGHHVLKHKTPWTVTALDRDGTLEWTSPLGHRYTTQPGWHEDTDTDPPPQPSAIE